MGASSPTPAAVTAPAADRDGRTPRVGAMAALHPPIVALAPQRVAAQRPAQRRQKARAQPLHPPRVIATELHPQSVWKVTGLSTPMPAAVSMPPGAEPGRHPSLPIAPAVDAPGHRPAGSGISLPPPEPESSLLSASRARRGWYTSRAGHKSGSTGWSVPPYPVGHIPARNAPESDFAPRQSNGHSCGKDDCGGRWLQDIGHKLLSLALL